MNDGSHPDGAATGDGPVDVRQPQAHVSEKDLAIADGRAAEVESPFVALRVAKFGDARCAGSQCSISEAGHA